MCACGTAQRLKIELSFLDEHLLVTESIRWKPKMSDGVSLSHEESLWFRGLARVDLAALNFDHALFKGHRKPLAKNVSRLVDVFRQEGCNRSDESNFVKAQVNHRDLDAALASQDLRTKRIHTGSQGRETGVFRSSRAAGSRKPPEEKADDAVAKCEESKPVTQTRRSKPVT
jgi:hypothetical protein